ncbi:MAG TPA: WXG100 family type VII secretion target [Acidimicrobiales bacterium]|nr:WXG100 family type VII secretion target [Acidimicrobiales bacterium]
MAAISVTPEQLQQISAQLTSGAGEVESILSQLAGYVSPLQGDWVGQAQARFESLWSEWQTSARNLHEALTGIAQLTQQAGSAYESNEQNIAASFRA